ncbi:MAG: aldehyde dehydrogenase family protein [Puniceicoccales bacterium]|jgi:acetaldehyde dehydrogenase/alcohol dehydrogenase|nr:aldehyde dehydrogenase family protein [Puniceicoccales bacterium]
MCNTCCAKTAAHELDALLNKTKAAQRRYASFQQKEVDAIFKAAAQAAEKASERLAKMAVDETGMGIVSDKFVKNHFASVFFYKRHRRDRTCGIVAKNAQKRTMTIACPLGVVAGVIPTTNPTSTAIFKALMALKTRNGIVFSPHPRAKKCTVEAARIVAEAAVKAGAPHDIVGWIAEPSLELTDGLMKHPLVDLVIATGGPGMVKAAYSSGKPALGVGAGNTPAVIDESANVAEAVRCVIKSKTFDNGVICASEQAIVAHNAVYDAVKKELVNNRAYILSQAESTKVGKIILTEKGLNAEIVGQSAHKIAKMAGVDVPQNTSALVSEEKSYEACNPFAHEKLSPILALYRASDFPKAVETALKLITIGGLGHTAVLHVNLKSREKIDHFALEMPAGRLLVNSPASQGAIGLYNACVPPSLTLGCGSWGGNSLSENVSVKHLLNYKLVAARQIDLPKF